MRLASKLALTFLGLALILTALEIGLRRWPTLLGMTFANGAASRYTSRPGGIHYYDPGLRMHFMLPNHRAMMSYNGYSWQHETDALGFRNAPLHIPADIMLLGDSVVYGHGVEYADTLGVALERRTRLRVVNLGQQGLGEYAEAYLLTAYLPVFRPRVVVHVFTPNDIEDAYLFMDDAEMEAFVAKPFDRIAFPPRTDPATLIAERARHFRERSWWRWAEDELYLVKLLRWVEHSYQRLAAMTVAEAGPVRARDLDRIRNDPASLGWRVTAHALGYMQYRATQAGARFLMAPIADGRQLQNLHAVADRYHIEIVNLRPLWDGPSFLPHDGHLSPYGGRRMADLLSAEFAKKAP